VLVSNIRLGCKCFFRDKHYSLFLLEFNKEGSNVIYKSQCVCVRVYPV
jgi:hypothetical protein